MTVKLNVQVEPVHETATIRVKLQRHGATADADQEFETSTVGTQTTHPIELEVGDKVKIEVEPARTIVLDQPQFAVRVEESDAAHHKEAREKEAAERKKLDDELKEDMKKRAENAKKLEAKVKKEADETEVPMKNVPFPAPLEVAEEAPKAQVKPNTAPARK